MTPQQKIMFWMDTLERVLVTFVQGFIVAWVTVDAVTGGGLTFESLFSTTTLKGAAVGGVLALVKSFVANKLPHTGESSASLLPVHLDPPAGEGGEIDTRTLAIAAFVIAVVVLLFVLL